MKIIRVTPGQFTRCVLKASNEQSFVAPTLHNLTSESYVVVDTACRSRFIRGDKIDLSFLDTLDIDLSYLRGSIVEDVTLQELGDTVFEDDSVLVPDQNDMLTSDNLLESFDVLMSVLGLPMVTNTEVTLSKVDNKLHVEFTDCPYFKGAFSVIC
jgi:hypothetical protein